MNKVFLALVFSIFSLPAQGEEIVEKLLHQTEDYKLTHVIEEESEYVKFTGYMMFYTTYNIDSALSETGLYTLYLNSPGGLAIESYDLGYYLKDNNIKVVVGKGDSCVSACAFAASIQDNLVLNNNGLFFHMPYTDTMPTSMSLQEFRKDSNISLFYTVWYMLDNGFSIDFIEILIRESDVNMFVNVENVEELNSFKVGNQLGNSVGEYNLIRMR